MLKRVDTVLCSVAGLMAGAGALLACLALEPGAVLTAVVPVALGVAVQQIALAAMKRRAWQRENAERI